MKQIRTLTAVSLILFSGFLFSFEYAKAAELVVGPYKLVITADKATALADGSDTITLTAGEYYIAPDPDLGGERCSVDASISNPIPACTGAPSCTTVPQSTEINFSLAVDGSNNYLNGNLGPWKNWQLSGLFQRGISCSTGLKTWKITSTTAEKKNISIAYAAAGSSFIADGMNYRSGTLLTLEFLAANSSTSQAAGTQSSSSISGARSSSRSSTSSASSTTSSSVSASAPVLSSIKLNNTAYTAQSGSSSSGSIAQSYPNDEPIVLSGTTTPNAKVTLYIYSDPITAETTADASGNWTYTINNLAAGDHRVEAEVTDPTTNVKSERSIIAQFSIAEAATDTLATSSTKNTNNLYYYIGGGILILLLAGLGVWWFWWRKRRAVDLGNTPVV